MEDHMVFADTLGLALDAQGDMSVIGIARGEAEAKALLGAQQCDVVLMDMHLEDREGLDLIESLHEKSGAVAIVMLTAAKDPRSAAFAISHGAAGFLTKDMPLGEVVRGIRDAARGRSVMDPAMAAEVLGILSGRRQRVGDDLTRRELEVLGMLDRGFSAPDVARELRISVNTARNHIARIITKLNGHSMLEAVAIARHEGILS